MEQLLEEVLQEFIMEGYVKCSEDLEFIYYKCKNQKTKQCKSALKEAKTSSLITGTAHSRACKLRKKEKMKMRNYWWISDLKIIN